MNNPYSAPEGEIVNIDSDGQVQYVGFWLRTAQAIIDTIIFCVPIFPLIMLLFPGQLTDTTSISMSTADYVAQALFAIVWIGFWVWKGATPAKMLFKTKIIDEKTGQKPTIGKAIVRYLMYLVSALPFFLGLMWVGWDKKKQGWHDKVAGTVVVKV